MMKNKMLLSLLLAGTMTLSLAACSGSKTTETPAPTPANSAKASEETKTSDQPHLWESGITQEMAYEGVYNYCHSEYDWSVAKENPSIMYVEMGEESETEYQVIFRSYTGAFVYFYVDKATGTTRMTEYVPGLEIENEAGTIELLDYLEEKG